MGKGKKEKEGKGKVKGWGQKISGKKGRDETRMKKMKKTEMRREGKNEKMGKGERDGSMLT